jgi:prevent-host-death family protein
MHRLHIAQDIRPLTEFRSAITAFLKQVNETKRPIVITQHGRGVAVLVEVLEEVHKAQTQLMAGQGIDHQTAKARVMKHLSK